MEETPTSWITLCCILAVIIIVFILIWVFLLSNKSNDAFMPIIGPYGVVAGVDGNALNICGPSRDTPCLFAFNTLVDCENQCEILKSICTAFTFNFSSATMKIIDPTNTFSSIQSNLFVRQNTNGTSF